MNDSRPARIVIWERLDAPGLEHLSLRWRDAGIVASGVIVGVDEGTPFHARYRVECDEGWRVRSVSVRIVGDAARQIELSTNGHGHWTAAAGEALPALEGCIDVDLSVTPFTNTLPIRRLALPASASADLLVAYISIPDGDVRAAPQRYTCFAADTKSGHYRFESLDSGYTADLRVDADGIVVEYLDLFRMIWPAE